MAVLRTHFGAWRGISISPGISRPNDLKPPLDLMQAATGVPIMGLGLIGMVAARSILFHEFGFYTVGGWVCFCGLTFQALRQL